MSSITKISYSANNYIKENLEKLKSPSEKNGMDIIIVTSAKTDDEAKELLAGLNMPFRK